MTTVHRWCLAAAALLVAAPAHLAAQAAPAAVLPPARAVVARFVEAIGGREAVERTGSRWERGRMEMPSAGITMRYEAYFGSGRQVTRSEMPGLGVIRTGFDGQVAWLINPVSGPLVLDGVALRQAQQAADPLDLLHPDRYVAALETAADTVFDGVRCYRVRITTPWDERYDEFFDRESGLLAGGIRTQVTPQGRVEVILRIVEWRTVAGARLPAVTRSRMMGRDFITTVDSTEVRSLSDTIFALPPEIRALRGGG